jgi:hypothetical protein
MVILRQSAQNKQQQQQQQQLSLLSQASRGRLDMKPKGTNNKMEKKHLRTALSWNYLSALD